MSVTSSAETFDLGRVLSETSGLIGRNFVQFFIMALLFAALPGMLISFLQTSMRPDFNDPAAVQAYVQSGGGNFGLVGAVILGLLAILPTYLLQAALTRATVDDLSKKGVSFGTAIQSGLRYIFPLLGLGIVMSLGIVAAAFLFIIPGIILAVCWMVSVPALVVERVGVFGAMQRSLALTRNHRWALFGLLVLVIIFYIVVMLILGLIMTGTGGFAAAMLQQSQGPTLIFSLVSAVAQALIVMVTTVLIAVTYFELRRVKEGVGVTEIASVFD